MSEIDKSWMFEENIFASKFEGSELLLESRGVDKTYTTWIFHGEEKPVNHSMSILVENVGNEQVREDAFPYFGLFIDAAFEVHGRVDGGVRTYDADNEESFDPDPYVQKRHTKYKKLAEQKLYSTCEGNISKL